MTTDDLHDRLDQLAAAADAPGRIDIDQARRGGRRTLRNRRAAGAIGSVAAVGLATAAVVAVPHFGAGHGSTTASSVPLAEGHSLIQRAAFGWLPAGQVASSTSQINGDYQVNSVDNATHVGAMFTAFKAGPEPVLGSLHGGIPAKRLTAAPVNGHHAYWIEKPGTADQEARLRWQYAPNEWGELEVDGTTTSATVYRIARSITLSDTRRLPFPFRLRAAPAGLTLQHATIGEPARPISLPVSADMEYDGQGGYVDISVSSSTVAPRDIRPNTTVDGHSAFHGIGTVRSASPKKKGLPFGTEELCVFKVRGLDVCVESSPSTLLKSSGGVLGLYHRLQVFGVDPSSWTTA
jgi:hypothetical protein